MASRWSRVPSNQTAVKKGSRWSERTKKEEKKEKERGRGEGGRGREEERGGKRKS